jgi:hypothetical protein
VVGNVSSIPIMKSVLLWGQLKCLIYETPVETEDDLQPEFWECVKLFRIGQGSLRGCVRIWCVAAIPATKSVAAISNSSCKLTENATIKIIYTMYNQ